MLPSCWSRTNLTYGDMALTTRPMHANGVYIYNTLHTRRMLTGPGLSSETWCFMNLRFDCSRALAVPSEAVAARSRARRRRFVDLGPHITANAERRGRLADLGHADVVWNGPTGFAV